jgi:catechol 2,3-dioxygenase
MSTASAPLEIGHVALNVNDLPTVEAFYRDVLGLDRSGGDGGVARLGAGGRAFLELRENRQARRANPREAGLFHTAFLLPSRETLARWVIHAAERRLPVQGASDHLVSEAIYLADPEGNGIEVYADKPREAWPFEGGRLRMATERLDLAALARDADGPWTGAPAGTVVGHVHLQVGDAAEAERFWTDTLGFDLVTRYPGASFLSTGGYHHHVAANVWNSRGAGRRSLPATGLAEVILRADPAARDAMVARAGAERFEDPWGTPISVEAEPA